VSRSQEQLNERLDAIVLGLDRRSAELIGQPRFFEKTTLTKDRLSPSELGMLRLASWYYVLFHEVGKVNIDFVLGRMSAYGLNIGGATPDIFMVVHRLRTFFQHNLDLTDARDRSIYDDCCTWFEGVCGTSIPDVDADWDMCLTAYLSSTIEFLSTVEQCLECISQDELLPQIVRDWKYNQSRHIEPHEYDELIRKIASDMGREAIDAVRMRKRYAERWTKELHSLTYGFDFEREARKLIELALLTEASAVIPITGQDILDYFPDIVPGPEVGKLLKLARDIYEKEPCSKEALLRRVALERDKNSIS
jgi:hypothetical protein